MLRYMDTLMIEHLETFEKNIQERQFCIKANIDREIVELDNFYETRILFDYEEYTKFNTNI